MNLRRHLIPALMLSAMVAPLMAATTPLHQHQAQQIADQFESQLTQVGGEGVYQPPQTLPRCETNPIFGECAEPTDPLYDPDCYEPTTPMVDPDCNPTDPFVFPECITNPEYEPECGVTDPDYDPDCGYMTDPMIFPECTTDPSIWPDCGFTNPQYFPECTTDPFVTPECSTDPAIWPECVMTDPQYIPECSTDPTIWPDCGMTDPAFMPECSTDPDIHPDCAFTNPQLYPECSTDPSIWPECIIKDAIEDLQGFDLLPNYPNPFNPITTIHFSLDVTQEAVLTVYGIDGRVVAVLAKGTMSAGEHRVTFDGRDMASGMYIYELKTSKECISKKMLLVR
jgi:hypothetical protein